MSTTSDLIILLRKRESIIADHAWRDRDSSGHLDALKQVSERISSWPETYDRPIDAKLRHFLTNASYAKALAHLEQMPIHTSP